MWRIGQTLSDGQDAGIVNAMDIWAEKLGGYYESPETIKRALENLPDEPPTLPKFKEMLRQAWVPPGTLALGHQFSKEEIAKNKARIAELLSGMKQNMEIPK